MTLAIVISSLRAPYRRAGLSFAVARQDIDVDVALLTGERLAQLLTDPVLTVKFGEDDARPVVVPFIELAPVEVLEEMLATGKLPDIPPLPAAWAGSVGPGFGASRDELAQVVAEANDANAALDAIRTQLGLAEGDDCIAAIAGLMSQAAVLDQAYAALGIDPAHVSIVQHLRDIHAAGLEREEKLQNAGPLIDSLRAELAAAKEEVAALKAAKPAEAKASTGKSKAAAKSEGE